MVLAFQRQVASHGPKAELWFWTGHKTGQLAPSANKQQCPAWARMSVAGWVAV